MIKNEYQTPPLNDFRSLIGLGGAATKVPNKFLTLMEIVIFQTLSTYECDDVVVLFFFTL